MHRSLEPDPHAPPHSVVARPPRLHHAVVGLSRRRRHRAAHPDRCGFLVDKLSTANTPWDQFLAGNDKALTTRQLDGARTFMTLKCSLCHTGPTFSDEQFHNVAVAQIGPGVGDGVSLRDDFGRMRVTGLPEDRYRFRTTPLRNVELTGPYGHSGSIASLRGFVEHYSESDAKLTDFDEMTLEPSLRGTLLLNSSDVLLQRDRARRIHTQREPR